MKKYQDFIKMLEKDNQYYLHSDPKLNLIFSVKNNELSNVKYYIKNRNKLDIDLNTKDEWGKTALIYASYWRFSTKMIKMVNELIKAGADWNITDNTGKDFIDYLNNDKRLDIVNNIINEYPEKYEKYLIKKKANKYNIL